MVKVYDMLGRTTRSSKNLRGILDHYSAKPADLVIKVCQSRIDPHNYEVTFFWPDGDHGVTKWADWRILLDWLRARRSWSISRVTFDAPLYDYHLDDPQIAEFRKLCAPLTRHAYLT